MVKNIREEIIQILDDEEFEFYYAQGLCLVRVSYDEVRPPITLASKKILPDNKYIDFVEGLGIRSEKYDVRGISGNVNNKETKV